MLRWRVSDPHDETVLDYSTGWGSVSDQGGLNVAFKALGLPLYFTRKGGASIEDVSEQLAAAALIETAERAARDGVLASLEDAWSASS